MKHKEVHLKAAEVKKKMGTIQKTQFAPHIAAQRHEGSGKDLKRIMKDEGFDEF
jgi:hypothetical protein